MLELTIPEIRSDQRLAAEFRPGNVGPWLARLPAMDQESCLQQLYKALTAQNRVSLVPGVRLELMELYIVRFQDVYALHHWDLKAISRVPLHPHYRTRQQKMLEMLTELAAGYKIGVLDLMTRRRDHGRDVLALAVQRAMHCLSHALVTAYELYMRPPGGMWREIHQLYRCAGEEGILDEKVALFRGKPALEDISQTYVSLLLVGAASPLSLLSGEVRRLYELTPQWRLETRITSGLDLPAGPGHFRIDLNADAPPRPVSKTPKSTDSNTRILQTLGVARAMHEAMLDIHDVMSSKAVERTPGTGTNAMDAELFRRAGRVLGEVDIKRGASRSPARQPLELCCGFTPVYAACNGGRPFDPSTVSASQASRPDKRPDEQFIDLSEPMLGAPINENVSPASRRRLTARPRQAPPRPAICVNQGAGGLCLVLPRAEAVDSKVGDVVACRFPGASSWQLGVVRWMRAGSKEVRLGIQFLGPTAIPVAVNPRDRRPDDPEPPGEKTPIAAIWLPGNPMLKQPNSLLLPRATGSYPPDLEIPVPVGGAPKKIRLLGCIERTGDYERFLVSVESPSSGPHSPLSS